MTVSVFELKPDTSALDARMTGLLLEDDKDAFGRNRPSALVVCFFRFVSGSGLGVGNTRFRT